MRLRTTGSRLGFHVPGQQLSKFKRKGRALRVCATLGLRHSGSPSWQETPAAVFASSSAARPTRGPPPIAIRDSELLCQLSGPCACGNFLASTSPRRRRLVKRRSDPVQATSLLLSVAHNEQHQV